MKISKSKIIALSLACLITTMSTACLEEDYEDVTIDKSDVSDVSSSDDVSVSTKRSASISLASDNSLSVKRLSRTEEVPMGEDGTWTIFVYMCGSDLESENGCASMDIAEMLNSSKSNKVQFVVETGGSTGWSIDAIESDENDRFLISNGNIKLVGQTKQSDMGNSQNLANFLTWGVENYPAAKMGLVMWNHGGGSAAGVCFDENYNYDSLTLDEMDYALTTVYDQMTEKFEFIGFDACLMATVEAANMLSAHANYMYASEETEPGYGWDYTTIGDSLQSDTSMNGADLGKIVADSFYKSCENCASEDEATFSVTDLSKIDAVIEAVNDVSATMYENIDDTSYMAEAIRDIDTAKNYGGNNDSEGYTNMVDITSMMNSVSDLVPDTDKVTSAIDDAVIYNVYGKNEEGSEGLSMYFPLSVNSSDELANFKNICISPYYMSLVDKLAYGTFSYGNYTEYVDGDWLECGVSLWGSDSSDESTFWTTFDGSTDESDISYITDEDTSSESGSEEESGETSIYYSVEPHLDENGTYTFTIDEDSLDYIAGVYCTVYGYSSEDGIIIDYGSDNYVSYDYESGVAEDLFDGTWLMLDDCQMLCTYLTEETDEYNIYTAPVKVNGEETNLRIKMYNDDDSTLEVIGVWDGIDENGMSGTSSEQLSKGDVIVPLYDCYDEDGEFIDAVEGDEYKYTGDEDVCWGYLPENDYIYSFEIDDIFGNQYDTDCTIFNIDEDGNISYYEDEE